MNKDLCQSCIKRKTMYCPNSDECMKYDDKPQWLGSATALQELQRKDNIINELEKEMNRGDLSYIETQFVLDKLKELEENK